MVHILGLVPGDRVELLVTWCHLLHEGMSDGESTCNLGQLLGAVTVQVLDDGLLSWLVVHDSGSSLGLQSHGHGH